MTTTQTQTPSPSAQQAPRRHWGHRITERDLAIVDAVARHRFLTTDQIATLFFPAEGGIVSSQCRTRLRHLVAADYLTSFERPTLRSEGRKPTLFGLTAQGRDLLIGELSYGPEDIDWKPSYNAVSWPFLEHQAMLNGIFITLSQAAPRVGWTLTEWVDDRVLKKRHTELVPVDDPDGTRRSVAVVPDAYFALARPDALTDKHHLLQFFVEADRATMTVVSTRAQQRSWQKRIRAYQAFFESDQILKIYGTKQLRVLTVTTSQRRLESLKAATEKEGGQNRYWFTTEAALTGEAALEKPIWFKAGSDRPVSLRQPE